MIISFRQVKLFLTNRLTSTTSRKVMKKTSYTLKDVKQPPVRLSSLRTNGIKHIDEIYRHELKMSNLVRKWKSSNNANNYNQSVKLPAIHPSPFLRLVTKKHEMAANADASNRNSFGYNTVVMERYEPKNSQLPSINVPKLRNLEENEIYTNFILKRKRQKEDLFKDKLVEPLALTKEGKDRLAIFNTIKQEHDRMAKAKICERTLKYKSPEMSIINKKMKMNQLNERKLFEIEQTIKKLEFEENGYGTSRSNMSEHPMAPVEVENPSSYLNIINYEMADGCTQRTIMKAPTLHGLISRPPSALNQSFSYNMSEDSYLKNIKSLKQFSNETDIANVNISKRILKKTNRENVIDDRTLDYYYELIKGRDLNLIDEMNIKYSNIKLNL